MPDDASPRDAPWEGQASPPCPDSWPPNDDSRQRENDNQDRTPAVDLAARRSAQQIVVQGEEPRNQPDPERHGIAQIGSGVRIEEAIPAAGFEKTAFAVEGNNDALIGIRRPAD